MRLTIRSSTGCFNYCNPKEESVRCHIAILKGGKQIYGTSVTMEYEENPSLPTVDMAMEILEECIKKMWVDTSRGKKEEMLRFLKKHREEINKGTTSHRIKQLKEKKKEIQKEINELN